MEVNRQRPKGWLVELALIGLWALWVGRAYLDFDPQVWPTGRELGMVIRTHYIWTLLPRCGDCMLWNGFINGGAPAFAELQGAVLHPLVIVATLIWGGINGAKVVLLASLAMAGGAQWWLGRVMGLGRLSRLWGGALAVVGGHLAGRMEHGIVGLVLSTAACTLVIPPALDWVKTGRRKSALLLGVTLALALLSGQLYMQLALFVGVMPAFAIYLLGPVPSRRRLFKGFLLALGLALLLSGLFWVPMLHFLPNFSKDVDPSLVSVQPVQYQPLNLVIRELDFYYATRTLGRLPYPYLYVNYVGWIPVLLALAALYLAPRAERRQLWMLILGVVLVYLCAGAVLLRPLHALFPSLIGSIRHIPVSAGLAVPLVIALASWGLALLLERLQARFSLTLRPPSKVQAFSFWRLLALPMLVYSLHRAYTFSRTWLQTMTPPPEVYSLVEALQKDSATWVAPPYGEHFWTPPALEQGLKLTEMVGPWRWKARSHPQPSFKLVRSPGRDEASEVPLGVEGFALLGNITQPYASVQAPSGIHACSATAVGGHIDVFCATPSPGVLTVRENYWMGWQAWLDEERVPLRGVDGWLTLPVPAGVHHFRFRYRPWDVPLGLAVTLLGGLLVVGLWRYPLPSLGLLAVLDRYVDRGWTACAQLNQRVSARLCGWGRKKHTLRPLSRLLNALAFGSLLALLVLKRSEASAGDAFGPRFLSALFALSALAGALTLWVHLAHQRRHSSGRGRNTPGDGD